MKTNTIYWCIAIFIISSGCSRTVCDSTSWDYNNPKNGGFQKVPFVDQETPFGTQLVEGGEYSFHQNEDSVSTPSFYISKYEETNHQYLTYLHYIKSYYSQATYEQALPDTMVWLMENLPEDEQTYLIRNYLRNPIYKNFPVVGVNPEQITKYANWKTDRENESILVREGVIEPIGDIQDSSHIFDTELYFNDQYESSNSIQNIQDLNPDHAKKDLGVRNVRMEDGILQPHYRMLTPDEWKLAALAIGNEENKYPQSEKEYKFRKKHEQRYSHLVVSTKTSKTEAENFETRKFKAGNRVYDLAPNNYNIYGMLMGVSEIVQDTLGNSYIVGGSWTTGALDYSTYYCDTISGPFKYLFPCKEIVLQPLPSTISRALGFRLAVNRVGSPFRGKMRKRLWK